MTTGARRYSHRLAGNAGTVRRVTGKDGRRWLVAPVVMARGDSVMPGSQGALFYPAAELARSTPLWNGKPVTLGHPYTAKGEGTSAGDPQSLAPMLGVVQGTTWRDGALRAEVWLREDAVRDADAALYTAMLRGQPVPVSTGLFVDRHEAPPGSHVNGTPYVATATNYRSDHLALLGYGPAKGQDGACPLSGHCGVNVNSRAVGNCGCGGKCGRCGSGHASNRRPERPALVNAHRAREAHDLTASLVQQSHFACTGSGHSLPLKHAMAALSAARSGDHAAAERHHLAAANAHEWASDHVESGAAHGGHVDHKHVSAHKLLAVMHRRAASLHALHAVGKPMPATTVSPHPDDTHEDATMNRYSDPDDVPLGLPSLSDLLHNERHDARHPESGQYVPRGAYGVDGQYATQLPSALDPYLGPSMPGFDRDLENRRKIGVADPAMSTDRQYRLEDGRSPQDDEDDSLNEDVGFDPYGGSDFDPAAPAQGVGQQVAPDGRDVVEVSRTVLALPEPEDSHQTDGPGSEQERQRSARRKGSARPTPGTPGTARTRNARYEDRYGEPCSEDDPYFDERECEEVTNDAESGSNDMEAVPVANPFTSEAQRRACYAKDDPAWDCSQWEQETPRAAKNARNAHAYDSHATHASIVHTTDLLPVPGIMEAVCNARRAEQHALHSYLDERQAAASRPRLGSR